MTQRTPFSSSADAPLSRGMVIGWGTFMVFVVVGLVIALRVSGSIPILREVTTR